jgi:PhzF family phenazine biosynthesis protein
MSAGIHPRPFAQVDVFTDTPTRGNPVAVVLDGRGLTTDEMMRFTEWTNLSEATFVLPAENPEADYRVRIFCPGRELPFAGHPTLGTAHAWLATGGQPRGDRIVQECGAGLIQIRRNGDVLAFAAPPLMRSGPLPEENVQRLVHGLGITDEDVVEHQWCDNGPGWQALLLRDATTVLNVDPDPAALAGLDVGIAALSHADGIDLEVRAFFPGNSGLTEDPVTGSLNAALAQWLIPTCRLPSNYVASQGTVLGRAGRVSVESVDEEVWVGGSCVTVIEGAVTL